MKQISAIIRLNGMHFYARHGVLPQEKAVGGDYSVNIAIEISPTPQAFEQDELTGTINYAEVYKLIEDEMKTSSRLLEHVCHRIATRLLREFPLALSVRIALCKVRPPIPSFTGSAEVELYVKRD